MDVRGAGCDRTRQLVAAAAAERALTELARRADAFPELTDDVDWSIVLVLMAELKSRRPVTVGDACLGTGAPGTTALRRIRALEEANMLTRSRDPGDARRTLLSLSAHAEARLIDYFA